MGGWCSTCSARWRSVHIIEPEIIRDRTQAGLASARARGRVGGRPPKLSADEVRTARRLYEERELTVAEIGKVLGVSRTSIYRALHRELAGVTTTGTATSITSKVTAPALALRRRFPRGAPSTRRGAAPAGTAGGGTRS